MTGIRRDKELRAESAQERGMEEKERKFAGTAELSDLVCYQQELTEARAERLLEHIYPQKHAHTQNTQFLYISKTSLTFSLPFTITLFMDKTN